MPHPRGEVYAFSEMVDHLSLPREPYGPFVDMSPGAAGIESRENSFTRPRGRRPITEEYSARHSQGARQALGGNELPNVYCLSDTENPAGGLAKEKSGTAPLVRTPQSEAFRPDAPRPLHGASAREMKDA